MPELPEVETTRRGIAPHVVGAKIQEVIVRNAKLRWPVPSDLDERLVGQQFSQVERRAKYLLLAYAGGTVIWHLGMSGKLRVLPAEVEPAKHDHIDIVFENQQALRFTDPRRFGSVHWAAGDPLQHSLLKALGPEPLSSAFTGERLFELSRKRKIAVKNFLMDNHMVVGVGNIYASESLFRAGIDPRRAAGRVSLQRYEALAVAVREVLSEAIACGGTTLRDYTSSDGAPGYFSIQLAMYGRAGEACPGCGEPIQQVVLGQRASFYCPHCQH